MKERAPQLIMALNLESDHRVAAQAAASGRNVSARMVKFQQPLQDRSNCRAWCRLYPAGGAHQGLGALWRQCAIEPLNGIRLTAGNIAEASPGSDWLLEVWGRQPRNGARQPAAIPQRACLCCASGMQVIAACAWADADPQKRRKKGGERARTKNFEKDRKSL